MTSPQLQITREGASNFPEVRTWASSHDETWKLCERMRAIHGWTDTVFLEILAASLVLKLHEVRREAGLPEPPMPPDPIPPTLYQIDEPPSRGGVILLVGIGLALAIVGVAIFAKGGYPWLSYPVGVASLVFLVAGYIRRI